jgi:hypothetical protein
MAAATSAAAPAAAAKAGSSHSKLGYTTEPAPPADFAGFDSEEQEDAVVFFRGYEGEAAPGELDDGRGGGAQPAALGSSQLQHFDLRVIYDPRHNSLEESVNFPVQEGTVIAGRCRRRTLFHVAGRLG